MNKVFGSLLVLATLILSPSFLRVALVLSLILGFILWQQCAKALAAQRKLRPIRIPVINRKK